MNEPENILSYTYSETQVEHTGINIATVKYLTLGCTTAFVVCFIISYFINHLSLTECLMTSTVAFTCSAIALYVITIMLMHEKNKLCKYTVLINKDKGTIDVECDGENNTYYIEDVDSAKFECKVVGLWIDSEFICDIPFEYTDAIKYVLKNSKINY